ncbi:MAG TPA: dTDP-4-dehydrorhamnose 3,5-epimerase [Candidatus Woesebacteria bacterium]|jgi:dTDP-4-dehydrorhamnose 3,5-epimerase|nr:dTDP-4-dehydrorhamnose 3,5-epimerase [Candidatus Woesebacteria bacterium]HOG37766.1 dTDP-4-dehydrorhamnose 3,5-epimerase [Candidatus Woesebacteria bacterium]
MPDFIKTKIDGLVIIKPSVFEDDRGFFLESYNQKVFADNGINANFVQDNHSRSTKGVLRGLHFQTPPFSQDKLIRCTRGEVFDVAVDIRPGSPTFGQYHSVTLSEDNKIMFFIPQGFAHGFLVLSDIADFQYKCSNLYHKDSEGGLLWNDPKLNIDWPKVDHLILSDKDKLWPTLKEFKTSLQTL